jgi:hypothetical protein
MAVRGVNDVTLHVHGYRPRVCAPSTTTGAARNIIIPQRGTALVWRGYLQRTAAARPVTIIVSGLVATTNEVGVAPTNPLQCTAVFSEFDGSNPDSHTQSVYALGVTDPRATAGITEELMRATCRAARGGVQWFGVPAVWSFTFTPDAGLTVASTRLDVYLNQQGGSLLARLCGLTVMEQVKVAL